MKKVTNVIIVLCVLYVSMMGVGVNVESACTKMNTVASWTYMVYFVGDHNKPQPNDVLYMLPAMNSMELSGSTPKIKIVVQADDYNIWNQDTRRYLIQHDNNLDQLASYTEGVNMWSLGEKNMGSPYTFKEFINWATATYPAERYCLAIFGHGAGWAGTCYDKDGGWFNRDSMDVNELEDALSSSNTFLDILEIISCEWGQIEVYYQLKDYCDIIIASEPTAYPCLSIWEDPLNSLTEDPTLDKTDLAQIIVNSYSFGENGPGTLFGVCTEYVDDITLAVDDLARAMLNGLEPEHVEAVVKGAFKASERYLIYDLYEFAENISNSALEPPIITAAQNLVSVIDNSLIISHDSKPEGLCGIRIHPPAHLDSFVWKEDYTTTAFAKDTKWDEFLDRYYHWWWCISDLSCVIEGTPINIADGSYKNIEDVKFGDFAESYDINADDFVDAEVTEVYHHSSAEHTTI